MFVTIRKYSPKNGAINRASLDLLRRQIHDDFLPIVQQIPGFLGYYLVGVAGTELVTLSLYETKEGSAQCNRCAAEYTSRNPLVFELGRPEVTEGEVLTFAEGLREAGHHGNGQQQNGGGAAATTALALWMDESRGILLPASER